MIKKSYMNRLNQQSYPPNSLEPSTTTTISNHRSKNKIHYNPVSVIGGHTNSSNGDWIFNKYWFPKILIFKNYDFQKLYFSMYLYKFTEMVNRLYQPLPYYLTSLLLPTRIKLKKISQLTPQDDNHYKITYLQIQSPTRPTLTHN